MQGFEAKSILPVFCIQNNNISSKKSKRIETDNLITREFIYVILLAANKIQRLKNSCWDCYELYVKVSQFKARGD